MFIAIIGSFAINSQGLSLGRLGDLDLVGNEKDIRDYLSALNAQNIKYINDGKGLYAEAGKLIIEATLSQPGDIHDKLLHLIHADPKTQHQAGVMVASLDVVYMLKMSHRYKRNSPHFLKTMKDIRLLREHGAVIRPDHEEYFREREAWTYNYKHPSLNQTKKDFFTDDVPYVYDHDSLHLAVAKLEKPAYNYYKPDEAEVFCSREMFERASQHVRLLGVYEEACVLALERSMIPFPDNDPRISFNTALMKVCTSITSGWFREFAWEHYLDVQRLYDSEVAAGRFYMDLFNAGLENGTVKPYSAT